MKVKEIMTKGPACCGPETRLDKVAHLMLENDCGGIPVLDGTRLPEDVEPWIPWVRGGER